MNKSISVLAILFLFAYPAMGQLYIRAGAGYAMPLGAPAYTDVQLSANVATYSGYSVKNISYSAGTQATVGVGYMINKHVGFQLDGVMGVANKQYDYTEAGNGVNINSIRVTQYADHDIILTPSLVIQTGGSTWNLYCRTGPALPVSTSITKELSFASVESSGTVDNIYEKTHYTNSFSVGYASAVGVLFNMGTRFSLWCEVSALSLSVNAKKEEFENYVKNAQAISILTINPSVFYFDKNGTSSNNPAFSQPFSNISFMGGIKFDIMQKRTKYQ